MTVGKGANQQGPVRKVAHRAHSIRFQPLGITLDPHSIYTSFALLYSGPVPATIAGVIDRVITKVPCEEARTSPLAIRLTYTL